MTAPGSRHVVDTSHLSPSAAEIVVCVDGTSTIIPTPGKVISHGSISTYTNYKCRCVECRVAWTVWNNQRIGRASPRRRLVSARLARSHARWLLDNGFDRVTLAEHCGVNVKTISLLVAGRKERINKALADKILGTGKHQAYRNRVGRKKAIR